VPRLPRPPVMTIVLVVLADDAVLLLLLLLMVLVVDKIFNVSQCNPKRESSGDTTIDSQQKIIIYYVQCSCACGISSVNDISSFLIVYLLSI